MLRKLALAAATVSTISASSVLADDALFHDLGGRDGIATIVDDATSNFLADPRIEATFDNTNMDRFKTNLTDQLCVVAGGPCVYKGQSMHDAHKGLHLTNADFNALVEDLQAGMDKAGVSFATQNRLLARLAPMNRDVVTK
jgi:hemoglobin